MAEAKEIFSILSGVGIIGSMLFVCVVYGNYRSPNLGGEWKPTREEAIWVADAMAICFFIFLVCTFTFLGIHKFRF
jgi:hypothetical protein